MRRAWIMTLKPGCEAEYERRHEAIWPELAQAILARGVTSFSIFRSGLTLFAYQELDASMTPPAAPAPVMARWWREMAELMETEPDLQPTRLPLREVFHLERPARRRRGGG
jgi:L-rhamnose mutarotase